MFWTAIYLWHRSQPHFCTQSNLPLLKQTKQQEANQMPFFSSLSLSPNRLHPIKMEFPLSNLAKSRSVSSSPASTNQFEDIFAPFKLPRAARMIDLNKFSKWYAMAILPLKLIGGKPCGLDCDLGVPEN